MFPFDDVIMIDEGRTVKHRPDFELIINTPQLTCEGESYEFIVRIGRKCIISLQHNTVPGNMIFILNQAPVLQAVNSLASRPPDGHNFLCPIYTWKLSVNFTADLIK